MANNKTLERALDLCGYVDVSTIKTEKIKNDYNVTVGHLISFNATKKGTCGTLTKKVSGIAKLFDVATKDLSFNIELNDKTGIQERYIGMANEYAVRI